MKICLSKCAVLKRNDDFVEWQRLVKKDGVLLFFMKTETERGFCRFLPCAIVKRRLGAIRKVPWRKGICRQKESRLFVGCSSIGSGEWNRTIDLQVMSLMSYHCSTPRHVIQYTAGRRKCQAEIRIFFHLFRTSVLLSLILSVRTCKNNIQRLV